MVKNISFFLSTFMSLIVTLNNQFNSTLSTFTYEQAYKFNYLEFVSIVTNRSLTWKIRRRRSPELEVNYIKIQLSKK